MIYFVQTNDNRYIKIGYAADVQKRVEGLRTSSPHPLKLVASMPGDVPLERKIHERFHHLRTNREWFTTHPDIIRIAIGGAQLTGIAADNDLFLRYAVLEPRLIDLLVDAAAMRADDDGYFCANEAFFRYHNPRSSLKARITKLVGHYADVAHPALRTSAAYDAIYDRIYAALPDCYGCACAAIGDLI